MTPDYLAVQLGESCARQTHCDGVALTLITPRGAAATLAATNPFALRLEQRQFDYGEGPALTSVTSGSPVVAPNLMIDGPPLWPAFTADALAAGVCAVFAFPLGDDRVQIGALNLFRRTPGPLSKDEYFQAIVHAETALTLLFETKVDSPLGFENNLSSIARAVDDRAEVYYATGMIAACSHLSITDATAVLRAEAFVRDRSILSLAIDIIDQNLTLDW